MKSNTTNFDSPLLEKAMELPFLTVTPDLPVPDVADRMYRPTRERDVSGPTRGTGGVGTPYALVVRENQLLGILSGRDLLRLALAGGGLDGLTAGDAMESDPRTLHRREVENPLTLLSALREWGVDRLPILDETEAVVGVVTRERLHSLLKPSERHLKRCRVGDRMEKNPLAVSLTPSLPDLARLFVERRLGAVAVVEPSGHPSEPTPVGLVTETDLVPALIRDGFGGGNAGTLMRSPPPCIPRTASLWEARGRMEREGSETLIVTGERGEFCGLFAPASELSPDDPGDWYAVVENLQSRIDRLEQEKRDLRRRQPASRRGVRLLAELSHKIRQTLDLNQILNTAVSEIRPLLECDRAIIYRLDPHSGGFVVAESVAKGCESILGQKICDPHFEAEFAERYKNGRIQAITDIETASLTPCHRDLLREIGVRANLVVPIFLASETSESPQLWGLLAVQHCQSPRPWRAWERELLGQLAAQVAIAIGQATLLQQARTESVKRRCLEEISSARASQQAAIARLSRAALTQTDLDPLLRQAAEIAADTLKIKYVALLERLPDGGTLFLRAGVGWPEDRLNAATLPADPDTYAGYTLAAGVPVTVDDLRVETRFRGSKELRDAGIISGVALPVGRPDDPFGVLGVYADRPRSFDVNDIDFLQAIANVLTAAVRQQRAERELHEKNAELEAILAAVPDLFLRIDGRGMIRDYKPTPTTAFPWAPETFLNRPAAGLPDPDLARQFETALARVRETGGLVAVEYCLTPECRDLRGDENGVEYYEARFVPFLDGQTIVIIRNISDRRRAQLGLERLNRDLEDLVERRTAELQHSNRQLRIEIEERRQVEAVKDIRARQQAIVAELGRLALSDPDIGAIVRRAATMVISGLGVEYCKILESGAESPNRLTLGLQTPAFGPVDLQVSITGDRRDGETTPDAIACRRGFYGVCLPILGRGGSLGTVAAYSRHSETFSPDDLHFLRSIAHTLATAIEGRRAAETLSASERRFRTLLANLPGAIYRCARDENWTMEFISEAIADISGHPASDFINNRVRTYASTIHTEDLRQVEAGVWEAIARRCPYILEYRIVRADGSIRWVYEKGQPAFDDAGNVLWLDGAIFDITESKQTAIALERKTEELDRFFSIALDLLCIADLDGRFLRLNRQWETTLGYPIAELEGQHFLDLVHPDDVATTLEAMGTLSEHKPILNFVNRYRCRDGSYRWIEWRSTPVGDRIYAAARDISDRKRTEGQLRDLSDRLALALKSGAIGTWEWDVVNDVLTWDDRMYELYGVARSDFGGAYDAWIGGLHPDDRQTAISVLEKALEGDGEFDTEFRVVHPSGSVRHLKAFGLVQLGDGGEPRRMIGINFDISDRKQAELDLEESRRFIERIADTSPNILYIYDLIENRNVYVNGQIGNLIGYTPAEIQNMGDSFFPSLMHPDDFQEMPEYIKKIATAADGEIFEIEYRMRDKAGNWHWLVSRDTVFARTPDGCPKQMLGAAADITERKRVEERLRLSERAIAASSNGIAIADPTLPDNPLIFVNPAFERNTGYKAAEVLGKNCRFLQGKDRRQPALKTLRNALKNRQSCTVVLRNYRRDGSLFWNELTISPIFDSRGNLTHYLGIQNDITASKQVQEQLQKQVKREQLLATLTRRIRESLDLESILNTTVTEVKNLLDADRVLVYRIESDLTGAAVAEAVDPEGHRMLDEAFPEMMFPPDCYDCYTRGQTYTLCNVDNVDGEVVTPCMKAFLERVEIKAQIAVPIVQSQGLWGLLIVHQCSRPRQWQPQEIELLQQLAGQLAIAIHQSELYERLQAELRDRSRAERALLVSQERLEYLLSSSPGILYSLQVTGDFRATFVSNNATQILGYDIAELKAPGFWMDHIHPEDLPNIQAVGLAPLFERGYYNHEYRFLHRDGSHRWIYDQMKLIRDGEGNPLEIVGYWIDISDRKQAEERLRATNEQLQAILDAVPGFVSWIDSQGYYQGVNRQLARTFGLTPEDFVGRDVGFLESSRGFAGFVREFLNQPELKTSEVTIETHLDGETRYHLLVSQKYDRDRSVVSIGIDITDRKRIEEQLWATTSRLSTLIENLQFGVLVEDEIHGIVLVNQAFCDLFGVATPPEKLFGNDGSNFAREYQDLFADPTEFVRRSREILSVGEAVTNEEIRFADGRTMEWDYVPIGIGDRHQGHLWMYRDISDRKQAESRLVSSLQEKEVLLKEIHHRVKNNLLVVSNLLEFQGDYLEDETLIRVLEESRDRIYSMALIHEKLYCSTNLDRIDFGEYLENLVDNLFESYNVAEDRISVELDVEAIDLNIETAHPCGLIVNELLSNTFKHAFPNGRTGNVRLELHRLPDDKIGLTVQDDGVGFPPDLDFHNVESLGMELICTLTEQLEGEITMRQNNGTIFTIIFSELHYRKRY
ncbi:PAS domain S-box protein [Lyngbya sp. CCY1209]|uniref:PAS domain S-box protein n=1 Tax=Lyngbya sp. CCY1209 TaxID=2886103 RepID=UPI002D20E6C8|nr:PAS domain S-box protein [Lyngbya sp. CCY1209]MEB3883206.1 PAS domain S-box protein [Lyngbya sp. CCY1209]